MDAIPLPDHDCPLRPILLEVMAKFAVALKRIEELERRLYGKKSEKMPPIQSELRKKETPEEAEARRLASLEKRRERAALRQKLREETVVHEVSPEETACPKCGGT